MERLNYGLVGCGGIANAHVNGLRELYTRGLKIFNVVATLDVVEGNALNKAKMIESFQESRPKTYTSLEDFLSHSDLDVVDICLPHNLHHVIATRCLKEGLDIIIEKPLGITMRAARKILHIAEKYKRILAVAENYRRSIENRIIWWSINRGFIGKPRMVLWYAVGWNMDPMGWRENKYVSGGSWVFDGGVHLADLDRYQLNVDASEVYAVSHLFEPVKKGVNISVDDMTMAIIKYDKDIYGQWLWTRVAPAKKLNIRIIYGSKGAVSKDGLRIEEDEDIKEVNLWRLRSKMMKSIDKDILNKWFPLGITDTFASELYDFYLAVINRGKPEVDGWEAYKDMAIPLAFYESSTLNKPVKVKDVEELKIEEYQGEINEKLGIR